MRSFHLTNKNYLKLLKQSKQIRQLSTKCPSTWKQPTGYETPIKIYNCIAKSQVPLVVGNKHLVSWYTCGPTVYDDAHIGHASCYMRLDILQRVLKHHFGLNIVSTLNITDIDDKIILRSQGKKVPFTDISMEYEKNFWQDMDALKISRPNKILRVTENMPLIIDFIKKLISDDLAYKGKDGSIYFDVKQYEARNKDNKYGKMQNLARDDPDGEKPGEKLKIKKSMEDFALWKAARPGEPSWEADFGAGRPGWHIECSSMASSFFGKRIDIHAGGVDLRFPHHENEEAQSCAYHDCNQWVNYWIHVGHLHLPHAAKMSKSLKNTVSIRDLLQTCDATVFRMACILTNYKNNMEFSLEHIKLADAHVKCIKNFLSNVEGLIKNDAITINVNSDILLAELGKTIAAVDVALCKDFDTPGAMKAIESLISVSNKIINASGSDNNDITCKHHSVASLLAVVNYIKDVSQSFGLDFNDESARVNDSAFNEVMDLLVNFRHQLRVLSLARKDKDGLALCDDVRDECKKLGITLKDNARISTWNR